MNTRQPNNTPDPKPQTLPKAFALVEVLIAIFILALGMVSIATIFPVAIHQSRQATDDVVGQMVGEQALALLKAKGLTGVTWDPALSEWVQDGRVITPTGVLVEGHINNSGVLEFDAGEVIGEAIPGIFAIPRKPNESKFIWAYDMVWPNVSFDPQQQPPTSPLNVAEIERQPQYAWKALLYKPDISSPLTATILVYRVNNWDPFWSAPISNDWSNIFPRLQVVPPRAT